MDAALIVAGSLALAASAIHAVAGEIFLIRKLSLEALPTSPFGDRSMTKAVVHVCWHMTTVALIMVGVALVLSGTALEGDAARSMSRLAAAALTGFWALALSLGAYYTRSARFVLLHPAPIMFTLAVALAWWGAL